MTLGVDKRLYILPFDHRGSFQTKMFGWQRILTSEQKAEIAATKRVIFDGFKAAILGGIPKDKAGILVDETFGQPRRRSTLIENVAAHFGLTGFPGWETGHPGPDGAAISLSAAPVSLPT